MYRRLVSIYMVARGARIAPDKRYRGLTPISLRSSCEPAAIRLSLPLPSPAISCMLRAVLAAFSDGGFGDTSAAGEAPAERLVAA